jgi:hypothetical protein
VFSRTARGSIPPQGRAGDPLKGAHARATALPGLGFKHQEKPFGLSPPKPSPPFGLSPPKPSPPFGLSLSKPGAAQTFALEASQQQRAVRAGAAA